ncbi:hypothetical protein G5B39_13990 (plasmid) [Rhodobacteraceae bacterium SC52]|nr:hypothetical protein G5B39_13990 [Rhodobacteraceae bacterium SC52]
MDCITGQIPEVLGRDRSTLPREVKRNWWHDEDVPQADGFWHLTAQMLADRRYKKRRFNLFVIPPQHPVASSDEECVTTKHGSKSYS